MLAPLLPANSDLLSLSQQAQPDTLSDFRLRVELRYIRYRRDALLVTPLSRQELGELLRSSSSQVSSQPSFQRW